MKPLKDNLNRAFHFPGCTVTFTAIDGQEVECVLTGKGNSPHEFMESLSWHGGDGSDLQRSGRNMRGSRDKLIGKQTFREPFPDDGYVVITYPTKLREVRIPFSLKNIELP